MMMREAAVRMPSRVHGARPEIQSDEELASDDNDDERGA
jgi:hypothetical protein